MNVHYFQARTTIYSNFKLITKKRFLWHFEEYSTNPSNLQLQRELINKNVGSQKLLFSKAAFRSERSLLKHEPLSKRPLSAHTISNRWLGILWILSDTKLKLPRLRTHTIYSFLLDLTMIQEVVVVCRLVRLLVAKPNLPHQQLGGHSIWWRMLLKVVHPLQ